MRRPHTQFSKTSLLLIGTLAILALTACGPDATVYLNDDVIIDEIPTIENGDGTQGKLGYRSKATAYYPDDSPLEGGFKDRRGRPLYTLQQYLNGSAPYVSVAMDLKAFPYGTKLRIPEFEKHYGVKIDFRVVDTGGAFKDKGTSRIDVCVQSKQHMYHPLVNTWLTLIPLR